ncbi:unnamed protein product [Rotaria sp. Silwood2]|nr:unnamed protein product [Rotaria sp. Silwood2]
MIILIKEPSEHSHVSDPNGLHIMRLKNEIKMRGVSSNEGDNTIIFDVLRQLPLSVSASLSSNEALLQTIRREPSPMQLDYNGVLPLISQETTH